MCSCVHSPHGFGAQNPPPHTHTHTHTHFPILPAVSQFNDLSHDHEASKPSVVRPPVQKQTKVQFSPCHFLTGAAGAQTAAGSGSLGTPGTPSKKGLQTRCPHPSSEYLGKQRGQCSGAMIGGSSVPLT